MLRQWIETADYEDVKATLEKVLDNFENGILYLDCVPAEHK
jgi:exonuclease VII small subunit